MISAKKLIYKIVEKISTLKGDISSLNTSVSSLNTSVSSLDTNCVKKSDIVKTSHTTGTITIGAGAKYSNDFTFNKAGYTPIALNGQLLNWVSGNTSKMNIYNEELTGGGGSATVGISIQNLDSAQCQFTVTFYITWVKA